MTESMQKKISAIDEYIKSLECVIESKNIEEARSLVEEIIAVYENEIKGIKNNLHSSNWLKQSNHSVDYIHDANILKSILSNYKNNLASGLLFKLNNNKDGISVNQNVNQNIAASLEITIEGTVSMINKLPSTVLNENEKELLNGKLIGITAEKEKSKRWEKIKNALKWIAEKGLEVGTVTLPFIVKMMEGQ